ncbi:MAG: T9SS type A sorting domain-containing protein, partial [Bacteroidales bacterium]|nr:T9SS type A sorting domain-containing protein [Bacteroidales bacterium]
GWDFNKVWVIRTDSTYPGLRGIDNAPFALPDFLKSNRTFTLSRLLLNDYDLQSVHKNLVLKIIRVSEGITDSVSKFTFPVNVSNGKADTLYYRVGKVLVADTLWGNTAKSVITLDETFTSVAFYAEKSESLLQNYPNPFRFTTTIKFKVVKTGFVSLKVFNEIGRQVSTLVNEKLAPGAYEVEFDGRTLSGGTYFLKIDTEGVVEMKKLILIK